ncbi:MAG: RNA methyltransferase [Planctomycetota bacterium]|nr:RNA methyltransferase [Planctomycetota bacterium]
MALSKARLRSLRSLRLRKRREKEGRFLAEGPRVVGEALAARSKIELILCQDDLTDESRRIAMLAEKAGVETISLDEETLTSISSNPSPQGLIAVIRRELPRWESWIEGKRDLLFLDQIQDPGNMGALIRAARAFGIGGILVGKGSVDPFHPGVLRAGAGAHFHIGISEPLAPEACLARLWEVGMPVVAADPDAELSFEAATYPPCLTLVLGNEGAGVSPLVREMAQMRVKIPLMDGTESINVAVASGILLYHLFRR